MSHLLTHAPRLTRADYEEAIAALAAGMTQLEPDGRECAICGDTGHQAWECHHNPLAVHKQAWVLSLHWRCFFCDAVFTDQAAAEEHFGKRLYDREYPACVERGAS